MSDDRKTAADRFADLFVFAPIGLATEMLQTIPRLATLGRERVKFVRLIAQIAVARGQRKVTDVLGQVFEGGAPESPSTAGASVADLAMPEIEDDDDVERPIVVRHLRTTHDLGAAAALAIPDYDSLSASQVVPRLAGLSAQELEAVRQYEAAHRARRTILGRVAQLQQSA